MLITEMAADELDRPIKRTSRLLRSSAFLIYGLSALALAACGAGEGDGAGGSSATSAADGSSSGSLTGCLDWSNWQCDQPSPGYEFGCMAVCGGDNIIICNQQQNECRIGHGGTSYKSCGAPAGSACSICKAAVEGCLHGEIIP